MNKLYKICGNDITFFLIMITIGFVIGKICETIIEFMIMFN